MFAHPHRLVLALRGYLTLLSSTTLKETNDLGSLLYDFMVQDEHWCWISVAHLRSPQAWRAKVVPHTCAIRMWRTALKSKNADYSFPKCGSTFGKSGERIQTLKDQQSHEIFQESFHYLRKLW